MNWKLLVGFGALVIFVVVGPVAINMAKAMNSASMPATGPLPTVKEPPYWTAENIVGTAWKVKPEGVPVPVTIDVQPGGMAVATVPPELAQMAKQMIGTDTLAGTWSVSGATLTASVNFQGKTHTVNCEINGRRIFSGTTEAVQVR